jgi:2'-5' RNA ligase
LSKQAINVQKELLKEIKNIEGVKLNEFDVKWHPHSTIAYGNTRNTFDNIWEYIKTLNKPEFDLKFDNITIMKKQGDRWKVHKEFNIRK